MKVIEVKNLYKKHYNDDETKYRYTKNILSSLFEKNKNKKPMLNDGEFWSLQDITFTLNKGDSLAVLGDRNSGKSLLLKLLTNRLYPDYGTLKSPKDSTFLDALRVGLNGHISVLENLYLKSALLSLPKKIVDENIDNILDFAEFDRNILGKEWKYLTADFKNKIMYAFFVICRHNFFVVDGLTHVGDTAFANKGKEKIAQISKNSTFIIATRHARKVKDICTKVLILDKGKMIFFGDIKDGLKIYD